MTTQHRDTGSPDLLCSVTGQVATLTLNNPSKRNALSEGITAGLRKMLPEIEADRDIRVLVLTGAEGAFCAGGDVSSLNASLAEGGGANVDMMIAGLRGVQEDISLKLYEFAKPTIAALPGPAAGAGMSIALACDMRIAASSAFIAPAFGKIALSGDFGGSWYLTQLVGAGRAKEIYFSSRRISSDEGLALGIFNRVCEDDALEADAAAWAAELAAEAPIALRYMKENINRAAVSDLRGALAMEADRMVRTILTEDHKASAQAFFEKRTAVFTGK